MKILIITSEPLNPSNTLGSTFELTQAKILAGSFDVSIISVSANNSLSAILKSHIRMLFLGKRSGQKSSNLYREFRDCCSYLFLGKRVVKKHIIEEITVYEGIGFFFKSVRNFKSNLNNWVRAGSNAFVSYVKVEGMPDLVHAHGRFLNAGALALRIKEKYKVKYVYTEHSSYFRRNLVPTPAIPIINKIIDNASMYTVVSESLFHYVKILLKRDIDHAVISPNVIDGVFETQFKISHENRRRIVFINIASLDHNKAHSLLLEAFACAFKGNSQYVLNICGEGELNSELVKMAVDLGLSEQVFFLGKRTKEEIVAILDASDIFVLSSRTETFGVAIVEALARGLPVVATRSGGPDSIVKEGCGELIEPDNVNELAEALKRTALHLSQFNRSAIRDYALDKYGSTAFLSRMKEIYNSAKV